MRNEEWFQRIDAAIAHLHELLHADLESDTGTAKTVERLEKSINKVIARTEKILMTQAELAAALKELSAQVTKIGTTATSLQKITDLQAIIDAGATVTPEVQAALTDLKAQLQLTDDLVPDAPTP